MIPAADRASLSFVRRASLDVLQRTPSPSEQRTLVGAPVRTVVDAVFRKLEAMEVWRDEELFYFLLLDNFRPKTRAVKSIPQRLNKREMTAHDAIGEIILSTSFSLRNPGNDTFVTVVLEQCHGITVQDRKNKKTLEAGKKMYDGERTRFLGQYGASQSDLVKIVMADPAFTRFLLARNHQRLFDVPMDRKDKEMVATVERVHAKPAEFFVVLAEWIASQRYRDALATRKLRTDRQFIRSLYMDLLERRPEYDEMRNMRNALQSMADPTPLRAVMAKVILDSGDAKLPDLGDGGEEAYVRECFVRYLGREPGQQEMATFCATLKQEGCEPAMVVRTLLGSAEYQYY